MSVVLSQLKNARLVFWDFDGVIKETLDIKSNAFYSLFLFAGKDVAERVQQHHDENGGMSRFEKLPLYLSWANLDVSDEKVAVFCEKFSNLVKESVIAAPWVVGVREYIINHHREQHFVLATATPQSEIDEIMAEIELTPFFARIAGAPKSKAEIVAEALRDFALPAEQAVFLGDARHDYEAAVANHISFILRETPLNASLKRECNGPSFTELPIE